MSVAVSAAYLPAPWNPSCHCHLEADDSGPFSRSINRCPHESLPWVRSPHQPRYANGGGAKSLDTVQYRCELLPRYRHLGYLKSHALGMPDHLCPDLDQLLPHFGQRLCECTDRHRDTVLPAATAEARWPIFADDDAHHTVRRKRYYSDSLPPQGRSSGLRCAVRTDVSVCTDWSV